LLSLKSALRPRRRRAPRAEETSDVRRFRGLLVAIAVAVVAAVGAIASSTGLAALRSPGPLSRPHRLAGLECGSCHEEGPPGRACVRCHGAHPSTRPAHRQLARRGRLGCPTCHAVHRHNEGLALLPGGRVLRYGSGWEKPLAGTPGPPLTRAVNVPLVRAGACAGCHDLRSPSDPVAACLVGVGAVRVDVCFDEHRRVGQAGHGGARVAAKPASRDAAWQSARALVARPDTLLSGAVYGPAGWLGAGLVAALLALAFERLLSRRGGRVEPSSVPRAADVVRLPQIDTATCLGCYACVDVCPYDVIEVRRYVATVARPDDCCGLTLCEQACPNGSLVVRSGEPVEDRPGVDDALESRDCPGLYLAGDLTGLPLIRNAINQGAHAVRAIARSLKGARDGAMLDLAIVGAGPAGISAALEAKEQRLDFVVLEQSSVAASIKSFPRGKLVFDQPLGMPRVGDLWLEESTKEELLGRWLRIVRREKLPVEEGRRVTAIEPGGQGNERSFSLRSLDADGNEQVVRARRVLLASGRRGTPRKLPVEIPESAQNRVFYHLADARSLAGQRVVIVGLGDVAMEAAIALAQQPDTEITVCYRGTAHRRGKQRNIDEFERLVQSGRIALELESHVDEIGDELVLRIPSGSRRLEYDALFVMIGWIPPWSLLESAGVARGARPD
jgi:thioredoxin reductase